MDRHEHDEPEDAPTLKALPKVDPFVVPEDFFERFPHVVQARIAGQPNAQGRSARWMGRVPLPVRWIGAAVMLASFVGAVVLAVRDDGSTATSLASGAAIPSIGTDQVDEADLLAMIEDAPTLMAEVVKDLSVDEMAAYLAHENIPLDLLIEEP